MLSYVTVSLPFANGESPVSVISTTAAFFCLQTVTIGMNSVVSPPRRVHELRRLLNAAQRVCKLHRYDVDVSGSTCRDSVGEVSSMIMSESGKSNVIHKQIIA